MKKFFALITVMLFLPGCSVFMAATSTEGPDTSVLHKGQTRAAIEQELGKPISSIRYGNGDKVTYQFVDGDKADYKRAALYAVLTGVTLGASELVTSPIEALQGERHVVEIFYDTRGRVRAFNHIVNEAPLPNPRKLVGLKAEES